MVTFDAFLLLPLILPLCAVWYLSHRYDPKRLTGRMLRAWTAGVVALGVWNALPLPHLGLNSAAAVTVGALGLPGMGLLYALSLL